MFKLFDLSLLLNGFPMGKARTKLASIVDVPDGKYASFTEAAKNTIFEYHLANNPFYKEFIGDKKISKWTDIPIMQKKDLQRPLDQRLSDGYTTKNVYINKTSGSAIA